MRNEEFPPTRPIHRHNAKNMLDSHDEGADRNSDLKEFGSS